jgi:Fe-S-cluster containining protein
VRRKTSGARRVQTAPAPDISPLTPPASRLTPLRFKCTGCGNCCTGNPRDYWVEVSKAEQQRIARHLGISLRWLRRRYVLRERDGDGLSMKGGACIFLDGARCRIYAARPAQCRGYPLWPELLNDREAWQAEARRCEGIGRGTRIPLSRIKKILSNARGE